MKDVNKIILIGKLGADPIRRETKHGLAVVHFPLETKRRVVIGGDTTDETQWHRVVTWGKRGESCIARLKKGSAVFVEGNLITRDVTGQDGVARPAFEVHADDVTFLGGEVAS